MMALGGVLLPGSDSSNRPIPEALYIKRVSDSLGMSPIEVLAADPELIQGLMEVVVADDAIQQMNTDIFKLPGAQYAVLEEMGYQSTNTGEPIDPKLLDRPDERWLLNG